MNYTDKFKYWLPVINRIETDMDWDTWGTTAHWLENQLGTTMHREYMTRDSHLDFPMSDEWVELFRKLDSPHWRTVLKAYKIQKGLEKCLR